MKRAFIIGAVLIAFVAIQKRTPPTDVPSITIPKTGPLADIRSKLNGNPDAQNFARFFTTWANVVEKETQLKTTNHVRNAIHASAKSATSAGYLTKYGDGIGYDCDKHLDNRIGVKSVQLNATLRTNIAKALREIAAACGG